MNDQPAKLAELVKTDTVYINYFNDINQKIVQQTMNLCHNIIQKFNPQRMYFLFSSRGGDVNAGIVLYNFLRSLPVKITMHNTGAVDSIATVVFLAGDERYAANHSTFLFHGVKTTVRKDSSFNLNQIEEIKSMLDQDQNKIAGIITERTKLTSKTMKKLFSQGQSKDLSYAQSNGIISDIREPKITPGLPFLTVNFHGD